MIISALISTMSFHISPAQVHASLEVGYYYGYDENILRREAIAYLKRVGKEVNEKAIMWQIAGYISDQFDAIALRM